MSGPGFVESEHPRNKGGEFAKKGEGGAGGAAPVAAGKFHVNPDITKHFAQLGISKFMGKTELPTFYHQGSNTKIVFHPSPTSKQSSKWAIASGSIGATSGEGIKSLKAQLEKILGQQAAPQPQHPAQKLVVPVQQPKTGNVAETYATLGAQGYKVSYGAPGHLVYAKGSALVDVDAEGNWVVQTPGHMTKEGTGPAALKLLLSGSPPGPNPPWKNSTKGVTPNPEQQKVQQAKIEAEQLSTKELYAKKDLLNSHLQKPTQEQREAVSNYTDGGYTSINNGLRHSNNYHFGNSTVKHLDEFLAINKLPKTTVFRHVSGDYSKVLKSIMFEGSMFMDRGYVSTSIREDFSWHGDLVFKINIPEGANGAYVNTISNHPGEDELILPRNSKFHVKSYDPNTKHVELDLVIDKPKTGDSAHILDVSGLPVFIETPKGTFREGGNNGHSWKVRMPAHYGYIEGVGSNEGAFEQMDCYVGPYTDSSRVFVVNQRRLDDGNFDEHKCMLGYKTAGTALADYVKSFSDGKGRERLMGVKVMNVNEFKAWLRNGNHQEPA